MKIHVVFRNSVGWAGSTFERRASGIWHQQPMTKFPLGSESGPLEEHVPIGGTVLWATHELGGSQHTSRFVFDYRPTIESLQTLATQVTGLLKGIKDQQ